LGACMNANAPTPGHNGGQERRHTIWRPKEPRNGTKRLRARGGVGSSTCKRKLPSLARRPASPAAARWRGASIAFPLGSKAGASIEGKGSSFSPWWPQAVVHAPVKKGGTARRREGRRQRRGDVEAEEVGTLDDGGSGSSHGRLRSSRRTASNSSCLSSPSPPPLLLRRRCVQGRNLPRGS
jgi:hypothetical protein